MDDFYTARTANMAALPWPNFAPAFSVTITWFTIVGGTGLGLELANPGAVSTAFEGFNLPAALLSSTQVRPLGFIVSLLFLVLTTIFVATTGNSMTD